MITRETAAEVFECLADTCDTINPGLAGEIVERYGVPKPETLTTRNYLDACLDLCAMLAEDLRQIIKDDEI